MFLLYFTLQYCIGFAIHWHESTTGVHGGNSCTSIVFKFLSSQIKFCLALSYVWFFFNKALAFIGGNTNISTFQSRIIYSTFSQGCQRRRRKKSRAWGSQLNLLPWVLEHCREKVAFRGKGSSFRSTLLFLHFPWSWKEARACLQGGTLAVTQRGFIAD